MSRSGTRMLLSMFLSMAILAGWTVARAPAQTAKEKKTDGSAAAAKTAGEQAKTEKAKAKARAARLPMYYAKVVKPDQREKIVAIMDEYDAKINALKAQVETLTKERDGKAAEILTPEQQKKVDELKAEAKTKRESKPKKEKAAASEKTAEKSK